MTPETLVVCTLGVVLGFLWARWRDPTRRRRQSLVETEL